MDADNGQAHVTYVGEVLDQLTKLIEQLQVQVQKRVLPLNRAPLTLRLRDAHTKVQQIRELLDRSHMSDRLGFVQENGRVQPVVLTVPAPVNDAE